MVLRMTELDSELKALQDVVNALEPLDADARDRVIAYAFGRLRISAPLAVDEEPSDHQPKPAPEPVDLAGKPSRVVDIRSLREEKNPRSANEMAAIAGYYLAE